MKRVPLKQNLLILCLSLMAWVSCTSEMNTPSNAKNSTTSSTRSPLAVQEADHLTPRQTVCPLELKMKRPFLVPSRSRNADKITVNANAGTVVYLRGNMVETFLNSTFHTRQAPSETENSEDNTTTDDTSSSSTSTSTSSSSSSSSSETEENQVVNEDRLTDGDAYCMVFNFPGLEQIKQLRVRVTPTHVNNLSLGRVEKVLRVDLPEKATNAQFCQGEVSGVSNSSEIALDLESICPNCTNFFSSISVSFHESNGSSLISSIVPVNYFNPEGLNIRINPLNDSGSIASTCDPFTCQSQGYDCCLNNQCVKDGSEKPNAQTYDEYFQAQVDVGNSYLNFKNYPNIYYICPQEIEYYDEDNSTTAGSCSDPSLDSKQECGSCRRDIYLC